MTGGVRSSRPARSRAAPARRPSGRTISAASWTSSTSATRRSAAHEKGDGARARERQEARGGHGAAARAAGTAAQRQGEGRQGSGGPDGSRQQQRGKQAAQGVREARVSG